MRSGMDHHSFGFSICALVVGDLPRLDVVTPVRTKLRTWGGDLPTFDPPLLCSSIRSSRLSSISVVSVHEPTTLANNYRFPGV